MTSTVQKIKLSQSRDTFFNKLVLTGPAILAKVLERHPLCRVSDRTAA